MTQSWWGSGVRRYVAAGTALALLAIISLVNPKVASANPPCIVESPENIAKGIYTNCPNDKDLYQNLYRAPGERLLSLTNVDLRNANFENSNLSGLNMTGANLAHANLKKTLLTRMVFADTDLTGADMSGANFYEPPPLGTRDPIIVGRPTFIGDTKIAGANFTSTELDPLGEWLNDVVRIQNLKDYVGNQKLVNISLVDCVDEVDPTRKQWTIIEGDYHLRCIYRGPFGDTGYATGNLEVVGPRHHQRG